MFWYTLHPPRPPWCTFSFYMTLTWSWRLSLVFDSLIKYLVSHDKRAWSHAGRRPYLILATCRLLAPTPTDSFILYRFLNFSLSCSPGFILVWNVLNFLSISQWWFWINGENYTIINPLRLFYKNFVILQDKTKRRTSVFFVKQAFDSCKDRTW